MSLGSTRSLGAVRVLAPARLRGELRVPGDKSISHRSALLNAIANGTARVEGYSPGGDCRSTLECISALRAQVHIKAQDDASLVLEIRGRGLHGLQAPDHVLDAGNSGTTARLLTGLLAGQNFLSVLDGDESLRTRPMLRVVEPLRVMGATILGRRGGDCLPLAVKGGQLHGEDHHPTVASAQVKSALLLAGLYADGPTTVVEVTPTRDHTERMLRAQGAQLEQDGTRITVRPVSGELLPLNLSIPGDTSSAAYWIALACAHPDARLTVRDVGLNPSRTGFFDVLQAMGGRISIKRERLEGGEPMGDVTAESSQLRAVDVGGELIPRMIDEVPLLAVAALFARGTTRIRDAAELRVKESDRLATTARELTLLGGQLRELPDGLEISGGVRLHKAQLDSHSDHRLAMCLAVAGMAGPGAEIQQPNAADISYPSFWKQAHKLGASLERS